MGIRVKIFFVALLIASFAYAQPCTTSNEWYYRTGTNCASGGTQTCAYSMGFASYLPAGGQRYLMMATGYDMNVYRMIGDGAPVTVQTKALGFPYSAISKTFWQPSIDSATGYGFAPYGQSASEMAFPSRVFKADPETGHVDELLKIGEDVAGGVGIRGMRLWGLSFSLSGTPFVAYNEAIEPDLIGSLKVYRFYPGPPASIELTADLGSRLLGAVVLRNGPTATIVGYTATSLVSWRLSLAGGVLQSSAAAVTPGVAGNARFSGLTLDDNRGIIFASSYSTSRNQAAIEAWDASGVSPVFLGSVTLPGVYQARPYAAGGGWVFASNMASGVKYLFNAVNPSGVIQVSYAASFPQGNPPAHGLLSLFGGEMTTLSGITYLSTAHSETGSWTRLAPECLGGVVPTPTPPAATPTPGQPGPTATPAPPGPCPTCPVCPTFGPTPPPGPTPRPSATPRPTVPPEPTSGAGWYCHRGLECMPGEPNPFGGAGCPSGWEANHVPCT